MKRLCSLLTVCLAMIACKDDGVKIAYEEFTLANGLRVVLQQDHSDPIVGVAIQYHVGSAREKPGKTGFAHFFEHMLFQRSENLPRNAFFNKISELGGDFNGSTDSDGTRYHEVVPRDALEKVLWMESDRMGYFINTVTQGGLEREIDVVSNEKRQNYDTRPYGQLIPIFARYGFPEGHPYSWTTIGELDDLRSATVDDVKEFYRHYYKPNNATLVISGDFEPKEVRALVEKYFGEIPSGDPVEKLRPVSAPMASDVKVMHRDAYASMPMLVLSFPTVEQYHPDSYAVQMLSQVLADGKNSPLYKVLVDQKKLSPEIEMWSYDRELAGNLLLIIPAFEGVQLDSVRAAVDEAFALFEKEGIQDSLMEGYKAVTEVGVYNQMAGVMQRALMRAQSDVLGGDPLRGLRDLEEYRRVTIQDVFDAYYKYIKGKPSLQISFVPAANPELALAGSTEAVVSVEDIAGQTMKTAEGAVVDDPYEHTPSKVDRSAEPPLLANTPALNLPTVWKQAGGESFTVWGVSNHELPVVRFSIGLRGGMLCDDPAKAGTASLYAQILLAGTESKTPGELEQAFKRLGADVRCSAGAEDVEIYGMCLARNLHATMRLLTEVITTPRFDENEFDKAKQSALAEIMMKADDAGSVAAVALRRVMYGEGILGNMTSGTAESVNAITLDDLRAYHSAYVSPTVAAVHLAGDIGPKDAHKAVDGLRSAWKPFTVSAPADITGADPSVAGKLYFIDLPGSQQSMIMASAPAMPRADKDYYPAVVANYRLGDGSQGRLFDELRLKRGYTYGAYSSFPCGNILNRFVLSTKVQGIKTRESVEVIREILAGYAAGYSAEDMETTRSSMLKAGYGAYETPAALVDMLTEMSLYGLPENYVEMREQTLRTLSADEIKAVARHWIDPARMTWIVVGDAKTQLARLADLGLGKPVLLDRAGRPVTK